MSVTALQLLSSLTLSTMNESQTHTCWVKDKRYTSELTWDCTNDCTRTIKNCTWVHTKVPNPQPSAISPEHQSKAGGRWLNGSSKIRGKWVWYLQAPKGRLCLPLPRGICKIRSRTDGHLADCHAVKFDPCWTCYHLLLLYHVLLLLTCQLELIFNKSINLNISCITCKTCYTGFLLSSSFRISFWVWRCQLGSVPAHLREFSCAEIGSLRPVLDWESLWVGYLGSELYR